jgi:hypothetical protein
MTGNMDASVRVDGEGVVQITLDPLSREQFKLLFLDVDGVINNEQWGPDHGLTPSLTPSIEDLVRWIDPALVALVNEIVDRTGAKIVLSSSTRVDPRMSVVLARAGLRPILAPTPVLLWDTNVDGSVYEAPSRADEIIGFLLVWMLIVDITGFAVLDDQDHGWGKLAAATRRPLGDFLVQTDFKTGITREHVEHAIRVLNDPESVMLVAR